MSRRIRVAGAIAFLGIFAASKVTAVDITVNTTADVINSMDGLCSLREAVTAYNTLTPSGSVRGECPGGSVEGDTINLPAGTYTLTIEGTGDEANRRGDLDVVQGGVGASLSIIGGGTGATIDANGIDRVFDIQLDSVVFQNLTIRGGNADGGFSSGDGGGIRTEGAVSLVDSIVENNVTGGDGGGIYAQTVIPLDPQVELTDSIVRNNTAEGNGGGIHLNWSLLAIGSTITGNVIPTSSFTSVGGGLRGLGPGGDMVLVESTVSDNAGSGVSAANMRVLVIASTISGNTTSSGGGGIRHQDAEGVVLLNSTVSGNEAVNDLGGGISADSDYLILLNSTFAANTAPGSTAFDLGFATTGWVSNTLVSGTCNLPSLLNGSGNLESPGATCNFDPITNQINVSAGQLALGDLADNGGLTMTHLPGTGSAAIDTGFDEVCPPTDQRGLARPGGDGCDVGSVELGSCDGVELIQLNNQTIDSTESYTACSTIVLGPDLDLTSTADMTLDAGVSVVFEPTVAVAEGAILRVSVAGRTQAGAALRAQRAPRAPRAPRDIQHVFEWIEEQIMWENPEVNKEVMR